MTPEGFNPHRKDKEGKGKITFRQLPGYTPLKNLVVNSVDRVGQIYSTPVTTIDNDYPQLSPIDKQTVSECIQLYGMDDLAVKALHDAVLREVFNSRDRNRLGIKELYISRLKSQATNLLMAKDRQTSLGLGNIKAFRLTKDVFNSLPDSIKRNIIFDEERQYVEPLSLAKFLNTGAIDTDYKNTCLVYGAIYAAHKDEIDQGSKAHEYTDWQKRYIESVIMCCSDPLTEESTPENVAYDNGFMLLKDPEFARNHFKASEEAIKKRQELSDKFFT